MSFSILLNGARGRMGRAVSTAAGELGLRIGAAIDVGDDPAPGIGACDVIIDFSTPAATPALLRLAVKHRKPIVIGTTGHTAAEKKRLLPLAARIPCVWAVNFSIGVNLLYAPLRVPQAAHRPRGATPAHASGSSLSEAMRHFTPPASP